MIVCFFTEAEARRLLARAQHRGDVELVQELRAGLGKPDRQLPGIEFLPELIVWYRDQTFAVWDEDLAAAAYAGITDAHTRRIQARREAAPLFAEVERA